MVSLHQNAVIKEENAEKKEGGILGSSAIAKTLIERSNIQEY